LVEALHTGESTHLVKALPKVAKLATIVFPLMQVPEGGALFDALRKVDTSGKTPTHVWGQSQNIYVGEPVFVPRGGQRKGAPFREDAGWVLVLLYDTNLLKTDLAIFDAKV
jgi:carotenoid cleavage dioxygenase-like enzyme